MSVDSVGRRVSRGGGLVVRPQAIRFFNHLTKCGLVLSIEVSFSVLLMLIWPFCSDKSYVESVVSFLHDVVPQASGPLLFELKICISITSSFICQRFPLFLSFVPFHFHFT